MSSSNESGATTVTTQTTSTSSSTVPTKLCHIVKRADFDGYGFNLHSEKIKPGQYIGKVDANSPASAAGLKEGDRIIEVNGVPIGNETHKQVVHRIKAISHEVRLLLIDADAPTATNNGSRIKNSSSITSANNNNNLENQGSSSSVQEMPGASANISTISMISTKRLSSNSSNNGSRSSTSTAIPVPVTPPTVPVDAGVTDKGLKNGGGDLPTQQKLKAVKQQDQESKHQINNNNNTPSTTLSATVASAATTTAAVASSSSKNNNNNVNKAGSGSLQLNMTAAEMRAKLMSKKKYDPKNESVDLKKKFEIIQKL